MNRFTPLAVAFLFITATHAQDWSHFRGPNHAGVAGNDIPTTWNDRENLAWRTDLPGKGSSSPVYGNNRLFVTAFSGYGEDAEDPGNQEDLKLHVLCLNITDGTIIWDDWIPASSEEQSVTPRVADHGYASPTPCVDDANVYAYFGPSGLVAHTQDGKLLWHVNLGTDTAGFGAAASPIVHGDLIIMNASIESGAIYGIDKLTGETRWKRESIDRSWSTPTIVRLPNGNHELIINQKGAVLGIDPETGDELWNCEAIQDYIVPCVIAKGDLLYCSGGRTNKTFSIRAGGRGDVTETHLIWEVSRGANVTSPILVKDYLYWSHDKAIALCLRASDGAEMFRERLPTRSRVYASIVSDGEKLFLTTRDAGVLVLAATEEYEELAINQCGPKEEKFNATPAIVENCLILRSDRAVYCIMKTSTKTNAEE